MSLTDKQLSIEEFHWHLGLLQNLDVGLIVLDEQYRIQLWNSFMENYSGRRDSELLGQSLFQQFPELPATWLQRKLDAVFLLGNRSFITWQERPYLFRFKPARPITGKAAHMYQNITLIPLSSPDSQIHHVGMLIYDMTDTVMGYLDLEAANRELSRLSRTDRLTGLNNRGFWEASLRQEFDRYLRSGNSSSLIMLDIDHFKQINDSYGHQAGDEVLRTLSHLIQQHARSTDIAGRYGGEEFGILLVDTPASRAEVLAERLRRAVIDTVVKYKEREIVFSISLGIAENEETQQDHNAWLGLADRALYLSKHHGRNQTTVLP